ncbi:MAG: hypothetical protein C4293_03610 [Nitrospiraceae bacterium]
MDKLQVVGSLALLSHEDPAESLQPGKQPLHGPAPLLPTSRAAILRRGLPIRPMRGDHLGPLGRQARL